eukprot:CAMPEP_0179376778 /NCGR_PEP_ID=MMETSP0797-20121207/88491_1 /TAXON_ID=47934 /ORGANISM="Dinophysis acuminata, Strain DAEP01" /LENGTH=64 /DNA_ID=CAMNT_0021092821 /DNA_START=46 /DNA_END=237 /DNA_ORIENTATION=-
MAPESAAPRVSSRAGHTRVRSCGNRGGNSARRRAGAARASLRAGHARARSCDRKGGNSARHSVC